MHQSRHDTNLLQSLWRGPRAMRSVGWAWGARCIVGTPQIQTLRSKKKDKPNSLCHHPSTSYGRYVDHFWVLPTRFYRSSSFAPHQRGHLYPLISWSYLQLLREIAWSTPSLWSSLLVRVTSRHDSRIVTGIAREWLARSGQLPLSIRIYAVDACEAVSALVDIINQYSTRWSDLDLYMPSYISEFLHAIDNHAPMLKSIRLYCSAREMGWDFHSSQLTCPRLERAHLSLSSMDGINIQLDNLTHLTLDSMTIIDSLLILRETPRLIFCKFWGSDLDRYRVKDVSGPVITSLRSLQLPRFIDRTSEVFLNNLIAPHLEEFSLPNYDSPSRSMSTTVITSFLRRSGCSLRSFSMIFGTVSPYIEGLMNLLQSMPSLNTLSIISTTRRFVKTTTPEESRRLWPTEHISNNGQSPLLAERISSRRTFIRPQDFGIYWRAVSTSGKLRRSIFLAIRG